MSELAEYDRKPVEIKVTHVPHSNEPAGERCVEMLQRSMRAKSKTVSNGYLAAARWFALATPPEKSDRR